MGAAGWNIYTAAIENIDADMVRSFIDEQREQNLLAESLTLELKAHRRSASIVKTVAAFANNIGGILLLGVDENNLHFDTSPGVDIADQVAVVEACRSLIEPTLIPEIAVVRIPETDKVVLVIRVDAEPGLWPVVTGGTVWTRAPGQSIGATRDQIRALCSPPPNPLTGPGALARVETLFHPEAVDAADATETCDYIIRAAGALWLRPAAEHQMAFGNVERDAMCRTFDATAFALSHAYLDTRSRFLSTRPYCEVTERTSRHLQASIVYGQEGAEQHRVSFRIQRDGPRVAFAVTFEGRLHPMTGPTLDGYGSQIPSSDTSERTLSIGDLALGALTSVEVVAIEMPDLIAGLTGGAPAHQDPVHVWVLSRSRKLSDILTLGRVYQPVPGEVPAWHFSADSAPSDLDGVADLVRAELMTLFLDLGLDDEDRLAAREVQRALGLRRDVLARHGDRP